MRIGIPPRVSGRGMRDLWTIDSLFESSASQISIKDTNHLYNSSWRSCPRGSETRDMLSGRASDVVEQAYCDHLLLTMTCHDDADHRRARPSITIHKNT